MGCGASSEIEISSAIDRPVATKAEMIAEMAEREMEDEQLDGSPDEATFIASVIRARQENSDNAEKMSECVEKLRSHNHLLKQYMAVLDATAAHQAMKGGFIGFGCNDKKLMNVLCTRTKPQLERTEAKYRELYDKDIRKEVKGETGGDYGRLMYYAMGTRGGSPPVP